MRFFIVSFILHLFVVFYFNVFSADEPIVFENVGNPDVSFSMVEGNTEPVSPKETKESVQEEVKKENKAIEQPKEEKKVVKEIKEEVIEVPEEEEKEIEEIEEEIVEEVTQEENTDEVEDITEENIEDSSSEEVSESLESHEDIVQQESTPFDSDSFVHLDDGSIVAKNQGVKGLSYGWVNNPDPAYPSIARRMKYDKEVIIKVRFLVGYDGRIEKIKFYDNMTSYGFRAEVEKTLKNWRATPISVDGQKVKLYFYKSFKFEKL